MAAEGGGLNAEAWKLAFRRGLGRALQRVSDVDADVVRPVLLDVCLNDRAYATQIEGVRTRWMAEFVRGSQVPAALVPLLVVREAAGW